MTKARRFNSGAGGPHVSNQKPFPTERIPQTMPRRKLFWPRVNKTDGCWLWLGASTKEGYGRTWINGKPTLCHRYAYEQLRGPIPEGLTLDHLCRVRLCVNPDHLEPVTSRENTLRGDSWAGRNLRKTRCSQGHPLVEGNLYIHRSSTRRFWRDCLTCRRERSRKAMAS